MRTHVLAIMGVLAVGGVAHAGVDHTCVQGDADVAVDGMLDDWSGVAKVRGGGTAADASFDFYCIYDDTRLALAINVRDDRVIRVRKGPAREDSVEIELAAGGTPIKVVLLPGALGVKPRRTVDGKAVPRWLAIEDTLQDKGFSIELVVPLAKLPGYSTATPAITAHTTFHDTDQATGKTFDDVTLDLDLALAAKQDLLRDFLRAVKAKPADVSLDQQADVDPGRKGSERVVVVGTALGVLADQFTYVTLPAATAADVIAVKLVDLRGDGTRLIAAVVREHGNGGARDVLHLFGVDAGQLAPVLAIEIRKQLGDNVLASTWKVVAAKQKGKSHPELVVEAAPAVGFDADSYAEEPAADVEPINLPWDDDRYGTAFWLDGPTVRTRIIPPPKRRH